METIHATTPEAFPQIVEMLQDKEQEESRIGGTREEWMVAITSDNPRERWLTRPGFNPAFSLQECFAWYNGLNPGHVERYNSNMERYVQDDGRMLGSAYGRYMRRLPHDQIQRVVEMLRENPDTRRAIINIHNASFEEYDSNDVACTIYLQPIIRDNKLHMTANLRSQDVLLGYTYDTHGFQWIQELLAGRLGVDVGTYTHIMNSCHYYTNFEDKVIDAKENYQSYELPDCRTATVNTEMHLLSVGLSYAREGLFPAEQIEELNDFYTEWLALMTAYEARRFHDDYKLFTKAVDHITIEAFRDSLNVGEKLEVHR